MIVISRLIAVELTKDHLREPHFGGIENNRSRSRRVQPLKAPSLIGHGGPIPGTRQTWSCDELMEAPGTACP